MLKDFGLEIAKGTRVKAFEEQFVIYSTLCSPSIYLGLSYPMADFDGKTLRPSSIISKIKKLFPLLIESSNMTRKHRGANLEIDILSTTYLQ